MGQTTKMRKKAAMPKRVTAPKASRMAVMSVSVVDSPFIPYLAFKVNHSFVTDCNRAIGDLGGLGGFPISLSGLDRW
jgi:hypothetical protein